MSAVTDAPDVAARAPRVSPWRGLCALLVVALLVRLAVILLPPIDLFERGGVPHEEMLRGVATKDMLDGALAPLQDYQVNHFWGGSLVMSLLAIPSFLVLGPTVVAMRLPALVFGLASVVFAFFVLDRFASRRAAWIGATLMALAPPGYVILSCTVYGTHMESCTLALGLALLYLEWRAHGRGGLVRSILLGVALGFALWFGYGLLLVIATVLVLELAQDKLFVARRPFLLVLAGFVVGFAPWIRYMLGHPGHTGDIYDISIAKHVELGLKSGAPLEKLVDFVARDWAESFWLHPTWIGNGPWMGRAVELVLIVIVAGAAWTRRASVIHVARGLASLRRRVVDVGPGTFALVYLAFFFAAYCGSDFVIPGRTPLLAFRYLMPVWPFVTLLAALGLDDLARRSARGRKVALAAVVGLALLFTSGVLVRCDPSKAPENWRTPAHSFEYSVRFLVLHFGMNADRMNGIVERIEATRTQPEQGRLYRAIAAALLVLSHVTPDAELAAVEAARNYRDMLAHLSETVAEPYRAVFADARARVPEGL